MPKGRNLEVLRLYSWVRRFARPKSGFPLILRLQPSRNREENQANTVQSQAEALLSVLLKDLRLRIILRTMLRVLLVNDTDKPIAELCQALTEHGYEVLPVVATSRALSEAVKLQRPDIVIVDTESPSRDTLEQLAVMHAAAPRPVLMFSHDADQQLIRARSARA